MSSSLSATTLTLSGYASRSVATLHQQQSISQSIPSGSDTLILVPTSGTMSQGTTGITYSSGLFTNSSGAKLTVLVTYTLGINTNTSGLRRTFIAMNGVLTTSGTRYAEYNTLPSSGNTVHSGSAVINMSAGDYFGLYHNQTSGSSLDTVNAFSHPYVLVSVL